MVGDESYDSLKENASQTFRELESLDKLGIFIDGVHHDIKVISSSDWKAGCCIEGKVVICRNFHYITVLIVVFAFLFFHTQLHLILEMLVIHSGLGGPSSKYFCRFCKVTSDLKNLLISEYCQHFFTM